MSNINLMAPYPTLNEEEDKAHRLKRAKISIDRITGYNGQRLLMNASRLLSALRWAILLDGPAPIPAPAAPSTPTLVSELTEDLEDPAGTDAGAGQFAPSVRLWYTRLWQQLVTKPLEHVGFAFFVGKLCVSFLLLFSIPFGIQLYPAFLSIDKTISLNVLRRYQSKRLLL